MRKYLFAALLAAAATTASAQDAGDRKIVGTLQSAYARSQEYIQRRDAKSAYDLLSKTTASSAFTGSPPAADLAQAQRLRVMLTTMLGITAAATQHPDEAKAAMQRAAEMPYATAENWNQRLIYDLAFKDADDALAAFLKLARDYPRDFKRLMQDQTLSSLGAAVGMLPNASEKLFLIDKVLLDFDWKLDDPVADFSGRWAILAGQLIDRGDKAEADKAVNRVTGPAPLLAMRLDRRFDAYVAANPAKFDVASRVPRRLDELRNAHLANPVSLEAVNLLAFTLNQYGYSDEALPLLDDAIEKAESGQGAASYYADRDKLNWTYDYRAATLYKLGRKTEAAEVMEQAAKQNERGHVNVSQTLNLAELYLDLERWADAERMANQLQRSNSSNYGFLVQQRILVCAADKLDQPQVRDEGLRALRDPLTGNPRLLQSALLCIGDEDGAARVVIARLEDPRDRMAALTDMQAFPPPRGADKAAYAADHAKSTSLKARPDVRAAVEKVGRYEKQDFPLG